MSGSFLNQHGRLDFDLEEAVAEARERVEQIRGKMLETDDKTLIPALQKAEHDLRLLLET